MLGFAGGNIASVPSNLLLLKNISAMGLYWGRYQHQDFAVFSKSMSTALQYCQQGLIHPHTGAVFKLEKVRQHLRNVSNLAALSLRPVNPPFFSLRTRFHYVALVGFKLTLSLCRQVYSQTHSQVSGSRVMGLKDLALLTLESKPDILFPQPKVSRAV